MGRYRAFSESEEKFLLERLQKEWLTVQRAEKLHEVARIAKTGGMVLAKSLLAFAVIAGVLSIAAVAPNAFAAYGKLAGSSSRRFYEKRILAAELEKLRRQGFVRARKTTRGYVVESTLKGRQRILRAAGSNLTIPKAEKWDGTWWLVAFDIPRRKNAERNALRERLKQIGMERLQASVFISRHPCADEVWFTARLFNVENYVTIAHIDTLEGYGEAMARLVEV